MVDGGTPEVDSMAEVEGSRPGDDRVGHASVEDACESRSVEAFESSQQDEEHHETEANDEIEEAGDDEEQSSDEEERESDALAERAKASGGVTSFIVSTDSTEPRAMPETGVANVVEPPREDDDWEAVKCDAVKADVKEAPIRMPSAQTCTMRGQVHDQGRMSGRWGMTREALDNLSQTSKFEYRRKLSRGAAPFARLVDYEPHALAVRLSGAYGGHFFLQVPTKNQPLKIDEKTMTLTFAINADDRFNVRGVGKNREKALYRTLIKSRETPAGYGDFVIEEPGTLRSYRTYPPKPASVPVAAPPTTPTVVPSQKPRKSSGGKDLMRVQAALKNAPSRPPTAAAAARSAPSLIKKKPPAAPAASAASAAPVTAVAPATGGASAAKRSARPRKAPVKLGDATQRSSAAVQQLSEPMRKCHAIVSALERAPGAHWFLTPVDPAAAGVLHYPTIVPNPMDLGTVKRRLEEQEYADVNAFASDVRRVFRNALTFNVLPDAPVHEAARDLHDKFEDALKSLWKQLVAPLVHSPHTASVNKAHTGGKGGGKKRDPAADPTDDAASATGGKRPRAAGGKTSGTGTKKSAGKGKKGPRSDEDTGVLDGQHGAMVPVEHLYNMQQQMASMQATIAALQKQAAQTEVQVQMNMEMAAAAPSAKSKAAQRKAALLKTPLTYEEKTQLSNDINSLPPEKLGHVVKIVQEHMSLTSQNNDDEIEIDIETLDTETLRHLQNYVKTSLKRRGGGGGGRAKKAKNSVPDSVPPTPAPVPAAPQPAALVEHSSQQLEAVLGGGLGPGFESDDDDDDDLALCLT